MKETILHKVDQYRDYMIQVRRYLHAHPELSLQEYETSKYLQRELEKAGIAYEVIEGRSIVATIHGGKPGKTVALRGDFDALPIEEATGLPFRSQVPGVMHACGHDCHPAMVLTAGLILNEMKDSLHGDVKLVLQEGEEVFLGALNVVNSGLLDQVDNICGIHVAVSYDLGKIITGYGVRTAQFASANIRIQGRAGHSSKPHEAVNAIYVATQFIQAVSTMMAAEINSEDQIVFSPTILKAGTKDNIIPAEAEITYNARYFGAHFDTFLPQRLQEIAEGVGKATGAVITVDFETIGKSMVNETSSVDRSVRVTEALFGKDHVLFTPPALFGDDFAYMLEKIPGVMVNIGTAKDGTYYIGHNEHMIVEEESLDYGLAFLVGYVLDYLQGPQS